MGKFTAKISPIAWSLAIILSIIAIYVMYKDRKQVDATNILLIAIVLLALFQLPNKSQEFDGTILS